jgi:hypothetical protein
MGGMRNTTFLSEYLKERDHFDDVDVNGRIIPGHFLEAVHKISLSNLTSLLLVHKRVYPKVSGLAA